MEKGGHLQSADSADCTVPSRMVPSSCGEGSDSLCHSSCTSGTAIFRQPRVSGSFQSSSQNINRRSQPECGQWWPQRLQLVEGCSFLVLMSPTSSSTCATPSLGPATLLSLGCVLERGKPVSVGGSAVSWGAGSSRKSPAAVCVQLGKQSCRNMSSPYDIIKMQHEKSWVCQQWSHRAALTWRWEIGVVETAGEERSLSWREADCVASFCNWSTPSMCCNKWHEENCLQPPSAPFAAGMLDYAKPHSAPLTSLSSVTYDPSLSLPQGFFQPRREPFPQSMTGHMSNTSHYKGGQNHSHFPHREREWKQEMRCPKAKGWIRSRTKWKFRTSCVFTHFFEYCWWLSS